MASGATSVAPTTRLRGDVQGLRAVAVLLVIVGHFGFDAFSGGYIGVDVFFVISGFLITGILARQVDRTGRISLVDFYVKRARRILPAASVALVGILLLSSTVYTAGRLMQVRDDVIWATFFAANIRFAETGTGYFDRDDFVTPVRHFWSLAVEEQFYLVWPLLILACGLVAAVLVRRSRDRSDAARRATTIRAALVLLVVLTVASFLWSLHQTRVEPQLAYYSPFTRTWELGVGALLALGTRAVRLLPAPVKALLSWSGLAMVAWAGIQLTERTPFPGSAAALPVVGSALVVAGGIGGPRYGAGAVLALPPVRWIGDISYSLYLWHWPLAVMPPAWLARDLRLGETLALIGLSFLLGWLSFRYVETPFRVPRERHLEPRRRRPLSPARTLAMWPASIALVLTSVLALSGYQAFQQAQAPSYQEPAVDPEPTTVQASENDRINDVGFSAELARAGHELPPTLEPPLTDLKGDVVSMRDYGGADCFARTSEVEVEVCPIGDVDSERTWMLIGDSHMGMWLEPLDELAQQAGIRLIPLTKQRCLPLGIEPYQGKGKAGYPECPEFLDWSIGRIKEYQPERVVLSGLWVVGLTDPETGQHADPARTKQIFSTGAHRTFERLRRLVDDVRVLGPTPVISDFAANCLGTTLADMSTCVEPVGDRVKQRERWLRKAAADTGVHYISMLPWFCDTKGTCPLVIRDMIVYRDQDHVTATYARHLKPVLGRKLGF